MDIPQGGSSSPLIPAGILKFGMLVFAEEGEADNPEKKPLEWGKEPKTNSTHIGHQVLVSSLVSSPVVSVLDSGSDGPGSSPGWGMTLCP